MSHETSVDNAGQPRLSEFIRQTAPAPRIHAGADALRQVAKEAERLGADRAFVICGGSVARGGLLDRVRSLLGIRFAGAFTGVRKESPLPDVQACVEAARAAKADLLVAIGGGSAVVTTRSVAILLSEDGPLEALCTRYRPGKPPESPRLLQPKLPNLQVLTTPTTAANWGGGAVRDPVRRRRFELFDPKVRPSAVIVDPEALLTAPLALYLNAAVTTYCATVEGLLSPKLNAFAQADLVQALALSLDYLPALLRSPEDGSVRVQLALAALLRNRATDVLAGNGGHFIATALVHALQSRFDHFPQGHGIAAVLGPAMRFTGQIAAPGHAQLAQAFGLGRHQAPDMGAVSVASQAFLIGLGIPVRLRELDIPREGLPAVAAEAVEIYFARTAPRPLDEPSTAERLLEEAW
jgi:alcohol dehydrogenase class IV